MNQVSFLPATWAPGFSHARRANKPFAILHLIRAVSYSGWMNRNPGARPHAGCAWPDAVCTSVEHRSHHCGPKLDTGNLSFRWRSRGPDVNAYFGRSPENQITGRRVACLV